MPKATYLLFSLTSLLVLSTTISSATRYADDTARVRQSIPLVSESKQAVTDTNPPALPPPTEFVLKPIIGVGIGLLTYWGNVKNGNSYLQNFGTSPFGYQLTFAQKLSDHVEFNLFGLFGTLGEYIRSQTYNWNFQSSIGGGGFQIMYKLLPKSSISPYFTLGAESYEFLSRTNMHDIYGNKFYYWSDGSVRSLPQTAPNASSAAILTPDYIYETDIRALDLDGSGKYSQQTFAIPIGAGFMIHVNKKADVTVGTTLHYTFTDHIDGLTPEVPGILKGVMTHDKFFMTGISFRYDLTSSAHIHGPGEIDNSRYDNINFDASLDKDTVNEVASGDTTQPSDAELQRRYRMYEDSTGEFGTVYYDSSTVAGANRGYASASGTRYSIELGRYSKGVPAAEMDKMLSVPDVKSVMLKDSTSVFTAGDYGDFDVAKKRQDDLAKQGITGTRIVYRKGNDFVATDKAVTAPAVSSGHPHTSTDAGTGVVKGTGPAKGSGTDKGIGTDKASMDNLPPAGAIVYRVQLGAYHRKLSNTHIFSSASNLVEVRTENGFYTYSAGVFTSYKDAATYKTQLVTEGFSDAFIKAYRNGKRIPLSDAGATYVKPEKENMSDSVTKEQNTMDKSQIKFKVQLGVFKGSPPQEMKDKFKLVQNLNYDEDESGANHFYAGIFPDYASAKAMKEKVLAMGIKGAFVVAFFKDKPMPIQEAISILKQ